MIKLLSTKILTHYQKELINTTKNIKLVEKDFIKIDYDISFEAESFICDAIFTSKNAVKSVLSKGIKIEKAYCVGKQTAKALESYRVSVVVQKENSEALAKYLLSQKYSSNYTFFCGNKHLQTIPEMLTKENIDITNIICYHTLNDGVKINEHLDASIFYSPSGVKSFLSFNKPTPTAFCIGDTTAKLTRDFDKVIVASAPNIDILISEITNYYDKK